MWLGATRLDSLEVSDLQMNISRLDLPSALSLSHGYTTAQWAHPSGCFTSASNSYKLSKIEPTVFSLSSQHDFFWVPFLTKRQHKPLNSLSQKAESHLRHLSHCFHSKLFPSSAFCFLQVSPLGPIFSLLSVVPWGWFPPPHCLTLNLLCLPLHHHTPACPLLQPVLLEAGQAPSLALSTGCLAELQGLTIEMLPGAHLTPRVRSPDRCCEERDLDKLGKIRTRNRRRLFRLLGQSPPRLAKRQGEQNSCEGNPTDWDSNSGSVAEQLSQFLICKRAMIISHPSLCDED